MGRHPLALLIFACARFAGPTAAAMALGLSSCTSHRKAEPPPPPPTPVALVVAPVINLSGTQDFDPLAVTDALASEFVSFPGVSVVPVNLVLAALARHGKSRVETPADAFALAEEFNADAAIVLAVTEYDAYDPPSVGLVLQWYPHPRRLSAAFPAASEANGVELSASPAGTRMVQVQKVLNGSHDATRKEVKSYANSREGYESPYDWKRYLKSQELYVRYCCWSVIRTMLEETGTQRVAAPAGEAEP